MKAHGMCSVKLLLGVSMINYDVCHPMKSPQRPANTANNSTTESKDMNHGRLLISFEDKKIIMPITVPAIVYPLYLRHLSPHLIIVLLQQRIFRSHSLTYHKLLT